MSRDDLNVNATDEDVRNEELRWNLSSNNFLFRPALHSITLAKEAIVKL